MEITNPRRRFILALLICAVVTAVHASPSFAGPLGTATLVGHLNLPGNGNNTDVWGWIHPVTGREYALVGDGDFYAGFQIIDCTDPFNPVYVRRVGNIHGFDVKVYGQYAYTVSGSGGTGGSVVDLLDVDNPVRYFNAFESSHNLTIDPRGWMFLSSAGAKTEVKLYELQTSAISPTFVWGDDAFGAHDASIKGTWLYDFHGGSFTRIYDITDPATPILSGEIVDSDIVYHHSGYPTEDFNYLFICDELALDPKPDITVWDISDLSNPTKVAEISDPTGTVHNLYIIGDYAYVSYYRAGFRVYDVSDPTNPRLADEYDTHGGDAIEGSYDGAFGVYPFTNSGAIFISDEQSGLFIFDFQPGSSTAVAISSFVATYIGGYVRVDWSIASADDLQGFHVYRSTNRDDGYIRLNDRLLPNDGGYRFDDYDVEPGTTYYYRLGAIDRDGETLSQIRALTVPIQSVRLEQNYPNPFNPTTTIEYEIGEAGDVSLIVFDARGREVRTLVNGFEMPGVHQAEWDAKNNDGLQVSSGVYFYRLTANGQLFNRRLAYLK